LADFSSAFLADICTKSCHDNVEVIPKAKANSAVGILKILSIFSDPMLGLFLLSGPLSVDKPGMLPAFSIISSHKDSNIPDVPNARG